MKFIYLVSFLIGWLFGSKIIAFVYEAFINAIEKL